MDPLSVAASVAGLILAAGKMTSLLMKMTALSDAPDSAKVVLMEMVDMSAALGQIRTFLDGASKVPIERRRFILLEHVVVTLTGCVTTYSALEKIIDSVQIDGMKMFDRIKWSVGEPEVQDIVRRMQNQKSSLILMLSILQCTSHQEMETSMLRLCGLVEAAVQSNRDISERLRHLEAATLSSAHCGASSWVREDEDADDDIVGHNLDNEKDGDDDVLTIRGASIRELNGRLDLTHPTSNHRSFERTLLASRVYLRNKYSHSQSSLISTDRRTAATSLFFPESLADISNISVFSLPICAVEISNSAWYTFGATKTPTRHSRKFQIFVKTMTGSTAQYTITSTTTCLQLKEMISASRVDPIAAQYLFHRDRWIPEATILSQRGIARESVIHVLRPIWDFRWDDR